VSSFARVLLRAGDSTPIYSPPMSTADTAEFLIEPRWLLPVAPGNAVLEGHAVAVSGGRILALGPAAELRQRFPTCAHIVRERHALLPGLVNAHTRACHTLLRGVPVRGPRLRWLLETLSPLERRALSADLVRDGTRLGIAEMLRAPGPRTRPRTWRARRRCGMSTATMRASDCISRRSRSRA